MAYTDEQYKEFDAVARPLIKWLNDNCHPHHTVVITPDSAELLEGSMAIRTTEYIKD